MLGRSRCFLALILAVLAGAVVLGPAEAGPAVRRGIAALNRQNYVAAAAIFTPLADRGDPDAQAYLGLLYAMGHGVPQNYTQAAFWYWRAAEQGHTGAQYMLGLLYDKGQGVPQNVIEAETWLILATAGSNNRTSDDRARIRDAVRTKMTIHELAQARMRALAWTVRPER
jgi:TPR repeat protein